MWAAIKDGDVHLYSNHPHHDVAGFILAEHPGATLKKAEGPVWNEFSALLNAEIDIYHDPVITEEPVLDENGEPVIGEDGEPETRLVTGPITVTRESLGRTWALDGDAIVVRDKHGDDLRRFPLIDA